ncbi:aminotransferase class I/II-fold pyridoxal phosphate-dependent enzyme [Mucilaginibacter sp. dw_454]|uniref:trans-sulfuration enzyme family protein n=1 Tax=Mucilaginibacter sp. dw_454 TaxID=2720079 RepID=UPI001BD2CA65|nr:aminotransferase class I/II-fold pyridoxal phosphate-dependent enzyme [Mucilaginibacter sp. dw_454]
MTDLDLSYILNELGEDRDHYFNAVSPPIIQSSNFSFKTTADLRSALTDEFENNVYSRGQNPTINILRKKLAALDGAENALVFSSGVAAITIPMLSLLKSGDHVVAIENAYNWTDNFLKKFLPKFGVTTTFVAGNDLSNFENAIRKETRLILLESPTSFVYELQNIEAIATLAKKHNIITLIDNSYCSPIYQQPVKLGIDLVAQSATKYIGGHSDVIAGVLTGSDVLIKQIFENEFMNFGPSLSPQSAWLLIRGLRTLPLRLQRSFESTKIITQWLIEHRAIEKVIWPFSKNFNQSDLAHKQMKGCGGLFSFSLKDSSVEKIEKFCDQLKHILLAVSWGGHESLILPSIASLSKLNYSKSIKNAQLIRMYVGLEDPQYLIDDLKQSLNNM